MTVIHRFSTLPSRCAAADSTCLLTLLDRSHPPTALSIPRTPRTTASSRVHASPHARVASPSLRSYVSRRAPSCPGTTSSLASYGAPAILLSGRGGRSCRELALFSVRSHHTTWPTTALVARLGPTALAQLCVFGCVFGCGVRGGAARVRGRCGSEPGSGWRVSTEPGEGGEPGEGEVWLVLEGVCEAASRGEPLHVL